MTALREIADLSQSAGHRRRWFASDSLDLIVWYDISGATLGFHLCYDKQRDERAITWSVEEGLSYALIDDGEADLSRHKASPILMIQPGLLDDRGRVTELFKSSYADVPADIVEFVIGKLSQADPLPKPSAD